MEGLKTDPLDMFQLTLMSGGIPSGRSRLHVWDDAIYIDQSNTNEERMTSSDLQSFTLSIPLSSITDFQY